MLDEKNIGNDSSSLFNGNHFPSCTCKYCSYNPKRRRSVILKLLPELFVYVYVALRRALQQQ